MINVFPKGPRWIGQAPVIHTVWLTLSCVNDYESLFWPQGPLRYSSTTVVCGVTGGQNLAEMIGRLVRFRGQLVMLVLVPQGRSRW